MTKENSTRKRTVRRLRRLSIYLSLPTILVLSIVFFLQRRQDQSFDGRYGGYATLESTRKFAHKSPAHPDSYRQSPTGHQLSSIGMGTSQGDRDSRTDRMVSDAIVTSVNAGLNVIDSASNYRGGDGEKAVGMAISRLLAPSEDEGGGNHGADGDGDEEWEPVRRRRRFQRSELFICSKAGFIVGRELRDRAKAKGATRSDFGDGGNHCVSPACLEASLDLSLERMKIQTVDLLYLHNVAEARAEEVGSPKELRHLIKTAFEHLELERSRGRIRYYGLATFRKSFRVPPGEVGALQLDDMVNLARRAAGCTRHQSSPCDHGMRFVQLPVSPHDMPELYSERWQRTAPHEGGRAITLAGAAAWFGVGIFSSRSLGNKKDARCLDFSVLDNDDINSLESDKTKILHVTRAAPGLLSALVGHKTPSHVKSNLQALDIPPLGREEFSAVVADC